MIRYCRTPPPSRNMSITQSTDSVAPHCSADDPTDIMDRLPPELKSYILEFLPLRYRLIMARMNKSWYFASLSRTLQRETLFVYTEPSVKLCRASKKETRRYDNFMNTMMKSRREFIELKLKKLNYNHVRHATIIENLGDRLTFLHVYNLFHFSGAFMDTISRCCRSLIRLKIESIRKFTEYTQQFQEIPSLKAIYFKNNKMNDRWFNLITHCAPNLEELRFKYCRIETDLRRLNIFYPHYSNQNSENFTNYDSKFVFTDVNITHYLKGAKNIKILHLDECLHIFEQLPQHIKLNTLRGRLKHPSELPHFDLKNFGRKLNAHSSLKTLELYNVPIICFTYLSELYNLNHLSITYWNRFSQDSFIEAYGGHGDCSNSLKTTLKKMKYLKTLKIKESQYRGSLIRVLMQPTIPEETLISVENLDLIVDSSFSLPTLGGSLKSLRLRGCFILHFFNYITLFRRVLNLHSLELSECIELCDDVLTIAPISNIKGLSFLSLMDTKLTHQSLRYISLFHLKYLYINLSLEPTKISQSHFSDFETSLKCLGDNNPNLEFIHIKLPESEREDIAAYYSLTKAASRTTKFKRYFKNLKVFDMPLKF